MSEQIKNSISTALKNFSSGAIKDKAIAFFNALGYDSQKRIDGDTPAKFLALLDGPKFNQTHALFNEWQAVSLLFQLTDEEMSANGFKYSKKIDDAIIESYLFFAITLQDKINAIVAPPYLKLPEKSISHFLCPFWYYSNMERL